MKLAKFVALAISGAFLTACQTASGPNVETALTPAEPTRPAAETVLLSGEEVRAYLVGHETRLEDGAVARYRTDGSFDGAYRGRRFGGTWRIEGNRICQRSSTSGRGKMLSTRPPVSRRRSPLPV